MLAWSFNFFNSVETPPTVPDETVVTIIVHFVLHFLQSYF